MYDERSRDSVGTGSRRSSYGAVKELHNNHNSGNHSSRRRLRSSRISQHSESATDGTTLNETNGFNYESVVVKQECPNNNMSR